MISDEHERYLYRNYSSDQRAASLLEILKEYPATAFWKSVASHWSGFDAIPHDRFAELFRLHRGLWTADAMNAECRAWYDSLPDEITIFRGGDSAGLSWTTCRTVALQFAAGHRGLKRKPEVSVATVRRSDVAFVCVERAESELVLFNVRR